MSDAMALERVVRFFESISRQTVREQLDTVYAPGATFKDPFNEVEGLAAIGAVFGHMFEQVDEPQFVVTTRMMQDAQAFLTWDFRFRMKRFSREQKCIRGATHIHFDAAGRVSKHRDYWDAAEELYEKLPLLGALMRSLKRAAQP